MAETIDVLQFRPEERPTWGIRVPVGEPCTLDVLGYEPAEREAQRNAHPEDTFIDFKSGRFIRLHTSPPTAAVQSNVTHP